MKHYSKSNHSPSKWALSGLAVGALAMYLGDPDRGRRRRAIINDKMHSTVNRTTHAIDVTKRDMRNRAQGLRASTNKMLSNIGLTSDSSQHLTERMRENSQMLTQKLRDNSQTLTQKMRENSQVLTQKMRDNSQMLSEKMRSNMGRYRNSLAQDNWSPSARALGVVGGTLLSLTGIARRGPLSLLMAASGIALVARSVMNMPMKRMAGMDTEHHVVDLHKSIFIQCSPEEVFDLWSRFENFPRFMSNIQEVRDLGNNRSHWVVRGPAGSVVEWDATTTESRRPEILAWISEPNAMVRNSGTIRFQPEGSGTRVHVHLSYSPPAGVVGHAVARMFGRDPKTEMDEDLMRMKAFIEKGVAPRDAAQPNKQPIATSAVTVH